MRKLLLKESLLVLSLAIMPFLGNHAKAQVPVNCPDVMLQAFDYYPQPISLGGTTLGWNDSKWTTLNSQAAEIGTSFQMIWLPPSGNAGPTQTMGYLPIYWFNQNSSFGSQGELKTLVANLKTNNCKAIADIVVNHRNGVSNWVNFPTESYAGITYTPNMSWICSDDECKNNGYYPTGAADGSSYEQYGAARDLAHATPDVRAAIKAYMKFMKNDIGYSGWRYDVAKGFPANYVGEYNDAAAGTFSVGEIMETNYDICKNWINNTGQKSAAFDFPAQQGMREAFGGNDFTKLVSSGQPRGLIAADMKRFAVTFVENHDTYRYNLGFSGNIEAANAFILSSPGVPCVYFPHWSKYKANIKKMIAARKKAGVHSQSNIVVLQSATNIYVAQATGTKGTLIVKVGSGSYSAPTGYTLECSGTDWAIWTKTTSYTCIDVKFKAPAGWTTAACYVYTTGTPTTVLAGAWPGTLVSKDANGFFTFSICNAPSFPVNVIFNNNNGGQQTITLSASASTCWTYGTASGTNPVTYTATAGSCGTTPPTVTGRFIAPTSWTTVKAYAWNATTTITAAWPGNTVTKDANGYYTYTMSSGNNLIFNNGNNGQQTANITNLTSTTCWHTGTSTVSGGTTTFAVVVEACSTTLKSGTITEEMETQEITQPKIYPNPAHDAFTIESDKKLQTVLIYSINGMLVKSIQLNSNSEQIDINNLVAGYYSVIAITEDGGRFTSKLIKQ